MAPARPLALALLGVLASVGLATGQCPDGTPPPCAQPSGSAHAPSVAVLLTEPRARTADDSLLVEGLTLELLNSLSGVSRLDVRTRWVSRRIAAAADPVGGARAIGVDYLVDAVLELDSARVLVRGALVRTSTGRMVRPLRIERQRAELQGLQSGLAQEIAAAVVGQLLPAERARFAARHVDPRATELVLRVRALLEHYTPASRREAIALGRRAVAIDSTYATAWVLLSWAYGQRADQEADSAAANAALSIAAAERALALDPSSGEVMARAVAIRARRNDLSPGTVALARRSVAASPGTMSRGIAFFPLATTGDSLGALALLREIATHDSLSPVAWDYVGIGLDDLRRFGEAAAAFERAQALRPSGEDTVRIRRARRWARLESGDCAGALSDARPADDVPLVIESLHCLGRRSEADALADSLLQRPLTDPSTRAALFAYRGEPDSAFALLDRAFPQYLALILAHHAFEPYRRHPAYLALRRRMGMEP